MKSVQTQSRGGPDIINQILLLAFVSSNLMAADWPQWRGPNRDGISRETGLLKAWPPEGPKLLWQVKDLGSGYSTPAVVGGRVYVMSNQGFEDEFVKALDVKDGSQVWSTRVGKVGNPDQQPSYPAARSTPTVDGTRVYALGSDGDLVCLETATGMVRWQKSLRTDFGGQPGTWAYSESPLVDGEVVVCTPGGSEATVVALNKNTGEVVWKCVVPGGAKAGYSSIVVSAAAGLRQYVAYTGGGLFGVEAKTGNFLWRYDKTTGPVGMSALTPVISEDLVYSATDRLGGAAVRILAFRDTVEVQEVYRSQKLPRTLGGALLVGEHLYGSSGTTLVCAEFQTGEIKWSERVTAPGALCYAEGRLYFHGENGEVMIVEVTPQGYRERGRFTPPNPPAPSNPMEKAWPYPVIADGRLFVRNGESLWCYEIKDKAGPVK
jgi:outer membrane protein assembly factor BamB